MTLHAQELAPAQTMTQAISAMRGESEAESRLLAIAIVDAVIASTHLEVLATCTIG